MVIDELGNGSPLLCVKQVAAYLQVSPAFVYTTMKRNVPHAKIGGALRFRNEDIDRYIASQTVAPMNTRDVTSPIDLREVLRKSRKKSAR